MTVQSYTQKKKDMAKKHWRRWGLKYSLNKNKIRFVNALSEKRGLKGTLMKEEITCKSVLSKRWKRRHTIDENVGTLYKIRLKDELKREERGLKSILSKRWKLKKSTQQKRDGFKDTLSKRWGFKHTFRENEIGIKDILSKK